jgi:ubiquinone/menaquinone biosynthesis C-methylase UbiE
MERGLPTGRVVPHNRATSAGWSAHAADWARWDRQWAGLTAPLNDALVRAARIRRGMRVLDVASGSGEPALSLAHAVGPEGQVVATDVVTGMLDAARRRAAEAGLGSLEFVTADAEDLPFADAGFDAVTCRFGLVYCSDPVAALGEMRRVLKPTRRATVLTWGPIELNAYWSTAVDALSRGRPAAPAGFVPAEFRFSDPSVLAAALEEAGFRQVESELRRLVLEWPGPPDELADRDLEDDELIAGLPPGERGRLHKVIAAAYARYASGERVALPSAVVIATGLR